MSLTDKKIKIAQVITRMDWGGSPDVLRIICQGLDPDLYEITLIIGRTRYATRKSKEFLDGFKGQIRFIPQLKRNIALFSDFWAFLALYIIYRKGKFDLVHTHTAKAGALGRLTARLAGVPVVIHTPHGHNFYGYFNAFISRILIKIEKMLTGITDKIMVLTELEKKDYLRYGVAEEKKLLLIYPGLELEEFTARQNTTEQLKAEAGLSGAENIVGFIGRLEPIKGAQYFTAAAKSVLEKRPNSRFILVGEGSLRSSLEAQVESWGLKDKIKFFGWREDIPQILSILDLLVLPSLNEAVGIVLLEAQSQGVPVIASAVGGIPETIKDKETGILVAAKDVSGLAQAVLNLLEDPEQRRRMSLQAKGWVRDRFAAEKMCAKISALYAELLNEKHVTD